jgi:hypothetical protein
MRAAVVRFFEANEAREMAQSVIGDLEGAMLVARPYRDASRFGTAAERLLAALSPTVG